MYAAILQYDGSEREGHHTAAIHQAATVAVQASTDEQADKHKGWPAGKYLLSNMSPNHILCATGENS